MASFNSFAKAGKAIMSGDIRNIPDLLNSGANILQDLQNPTGSAYVSDVASVDWSDPKGFNKTISGRIRID